MSYGHTLLIPEINQDQKVKWCIKENLFKTSHSYVRHKSMMVAVVRFSVIFAYRENPV